MSSWDARSIRVLEQLSIYKFVESNSGLLHKRVLDYGAGKPGTCRRPEPYRELVFGEYCPYDKGDAIPEGRFNAILCTQVVQYVEDVPALFSGFYGLLADRGFLVMTGPTTWEEVEEKDYWRFTLSGVRKLAEDAGFTVASLKSRANINLGGFDLSLGWGLVAQREHADQVIGR